MGRIRYDNCCAGKGKMQKNLYLLNIFLIVAQSRENMGNLKKKRRLKMNKHKRSKRSRANRHKKRLWGN
jgi:hypothetical protein